MMVFFVKDCTETMVKFVCPYMEIKLINASLLMMTIVLHFNSISSNLANQLTSKINDFIFLYALIYTDIADMVHIAFLFVVLTLFVV